MRPVYYRDQRRKGLGAPSWLNSILDVASEAGGAVAEAYGGKMAGEGVRAAHKIWTGLALKDKGGGGGGKPAPPPPRPPAAPPGVIMGPPGGGPMPPPRPLARPRPRMAMMAKRPKVAPSSAVVVGPSPTPTPTEASVLGGGSSKGMFIFGVISAVAIGAYLLLQKKPPQTAGAQHEQ